MSAPSTPAKAGVQSRPHNGWTPAFAGVLLALSACTVGPDYARPADTTAGQWLAPTESTPVDTSWWHALNDPVLTELVDQAVARNLDLKEAEARLREARANRDAAAGRRLPQLNATGSATQNQLSENGQIPVGNIPGFDRSFPLFDAGFDAAWEIDLWGRNARTVEAAGARTEAAEAARHETLMRIIAEVVRSYADLRGAQARYASAAGDAEAQEGIARLVNERYRAGESARFDWLRADAQAKSTRAAIAGIDADAKAAAWRLALLTGQPPEAVAEKLLAPAPLPHSPATVAAGLRSDLLRRRPDIVQAERELAAATADIGVASAELFPRLSLLGSIGQQAQSGGDFFSGGSTRFSIGPSLHWPIFAGGTIRANIRAADARADAAGARYESAVLTALSDSETALNRYAAAQVTRADRETARTQTAEALALARQRFRAGEDDLIVLLDAQSAYSAAERQSIDARIAELQALVALYKALGGGWESGG
ncbi:efflux transporter outer membrane subunit [Sphingomonas cavernae]|uniref:Efflux transporter outer membrane subunit n=1 Tax=Sphingomonas cavernae TaxID=2320861 RepID=A0A418W858_9SPHN|nr:efflux transporter outer membrane subunit [Sphingomonas cavernae]